MRSRRTTRFGDEETYDYCESIGMSNTKELETLDMQLLAHARKTGWAALAKAYHKVGKEWIHVGGGGGWQTRHASVLEFLGAYRKIIIDYLITNYTLKLQEEADNKNAYKSFRGTRPLRELVTYAALGSTNPTSDYDVTLCGPGLHCILRHVIADFERLPIPKSDCDDCITMSFTFDSNFYTGPDMLVKRGESRFEGITLFYPDGLDETKTHNVAVPVPTGEHITTERAFILRKLTPEHSSSIRDKYREMIRLTEELDKVLYRGDGKSAVEASELFRMLYELKVTSIEAYYGVSTVLVVVYGMQAGKLGAISNVMGVGNYENACLENLLDFTAHWNEYASTEPRASDDSRKITLIKLSKYLQRVLTCIDEIAKNGRTFSVDAELRAQIGLLVAGRASATADTLVVHHGMRQHGESNALLQREGKPPVEMHKLYFSEYGIPSEGAIKLDKNGAGLVHRLYAHLMRD